MKDKVTIKENIITIFIAFLGVILLIGAISFEIYNYILDQKAITINATVTEVNYNNNTATVLYKVEDKTYSKIIKVRDVTVNTEVPITYNKDNPSNLINNKYYIYIAIVAFITSLIIIKMKLPSAIDIIVRQISIRKMKKEGYILALPISEIIIDNTKKQVKGSYPYKIRTKYINPQNNMEYTYESDSIYVNLSYTIQKYSVTSVKVFLDKTNTNNYYVDLKSLIPDIPIINPEVLMNLDKKAKEEKQEENPEVTEEEKNGEQQENK